MTPNRIREPGFFFHVTARGNNRQDIFRTVFDKNDYLVRLAEIFPSHHIRLLAYCLMTNHFHLLVQDAKGGGLPPAMQRIQGGYAQAWNRRHRQSGHVFGERYNAEPVESDEHLIVGSCYIHVNPRDAGMVRDAQTYRWSSARAYTGGHSDIPVSTDLILELCGGPKAYADMLKDSKGSLFSDKEHLPDAAKIRELWTSGTLQFRDRVESLVERRVERRMLKRRPEGKNMEKIFLEVSQQTGVSYEEMAGPSRTRRVTSARAILCATARREGIAATEIAGEIRKTRAAVVQLAARYETELDHRA